MDAQNEFRMVVSPPEKRERKLTIEWPEKSVLLANRDKFVLENMEEMRIELKEDFVMEEGDPIDDMARIVLSAKFMFLEMNKISPIPMETSYQVIDNYDYKEEGDVMGINPGVDNYCDIYVYTLWEKFDEGWKDLDVFAMGSAVHEFAHLIYKQEAKLYKQPKKIAGLSESPKMRSSVESKYTAYLARDIEHRGRIWQLNFLKHYFPDSDYTYQVEVAIRTGKEIRRDRRNRGLM
jgi:hypothetical protein